MAAFSASKRLIGGGAGSGGRLRFVGGSGATTAGVGVGTTT
jgi:hypothetical protein